MATPMPHQIMPTEIDTTNITSVMITRRTKGGRTLHYELTCLQQPERARACGSGQKSAADRRPVDPPPVVQLRIYEGPQYEGAKDITMFYNANFFCYVDLQHARPIANGRVQTPMATSPPVLTGAPVSGMAYLDRPAEAGYFLFPDLSVRHEGTYVLGFSLYEELKDSQDRDWDTPDDQDVDPSFFHRMRVVSNPFAVFSAKKFPGLTSSTSLSRTISEQGCRVRIRRDVRMRRRDTKPTSDDYNKKEDSNRAQRSPSPEHKKEQYRNRSASNSSQHRMQYSNEHRPSDVETYAPPPPPPAPPAPISIPAAPPAPPAHARYGSDMSQTGYATQHIQPAPQPSPISPTSSHYSSQPSPYAPGPQSSHNYLSRPAPPGYANIVNTPQAHDAYDRRSSGATTIPPSPSPSHSHSHYSVKDEYRRESLYRHDDYGRAPETRRDSQPLAALHAPPSAYGAIRLPPIGDVSKLSGPHSFPSISASFHAPPPPRPHDYIEPGPLLPPTIREPVRAGSKRAYNDTFAESSRPLYDGQRPQDVHLATAGRRVAYDPEDPDRMVYPRADGQIVVKTANAFYMS